MLAGHQPAVGKQTVSVLFLKYWQFAEEYYRKGGCATNEQDGIKSSLRYLRGLYGQSPINEFGPLNLTRDRDFASNLEPLGV